MAKQKSLRNGVIAVLVFAFVALVAWAVLYVIFVLGIKELNLLEEHFKQVMAMFYLPQDYIANYIGLFVILGLAGISFLLMIIMSCVQKRGIMILPFFVHLLALVAAAELVSNMANYTVSNTTTPTGYIYLMFSAEKMSVRIMAYCIVGTAALALILSFIAFILAAAHTGAYSKQKLRVLAEPEQLPADEDPLPEFVPEPEEHDDRAELIDMIKNLIHEELKNHQPSNQTVTGATFAAPLVVQYFNGMNPVQQPQEQPKPEEPKKEEPVQPKWELVVEPEEVKEEQPVEPAPVQEEPQPEPEPEPQPEPEPAPVQEEPVPEPLPEPVPEPQPEPAPEKKPIIRIPFDERMVKAEKEMKDNYNEIKNEILSYGVKSRVSNSGDTFRLHRKTYVKITIAGKSLKLYFALNPDDYKDTTIPVQDASEKGIYEEIPLVFKVKSGLSVKRCKQLIADVMEKDNLTQGEIGKVNWVKEIAANLRAEKKAQKEAEEDED